MRAFQRDSLVLGLAFAAGSLDSWSYFQLSHVFIANMTGNTVILGYSAATAAWPRAGMSGLAIASYAIGVFGGALLSKPIRAEVQNHGADVVLWPRRTTVVLGLELALVLAIAIAAAVKAPITDSPLARLLVCIGAAAEGMQGAAMSALNLPGIVTTYISGTWTTFTAGVAQLLDGEEIGPKRTEWERRLVMQAAVLAVYCGSAALVGFLHRTQGSAVLGWVPAAALALVVAGAFRWRR